MHSYGRINHMLARAGLNPSRTGKTLISAQVDTLPPADADPRSRAFADHPIIHRASPAPASSRTPSSTPAHRPTPTSTHRIFAYHTTRTVQFVVERHAVHAHSRAHSKEKKKKRLTGPLQRKEKEKTTPCGAWITGGAARLGPKAVRAPTGPTPNLHALHTTPHALYNVYPPCPRPSPPPQPRVC